MTLVAATAVLQPTAISVAEEEGSCSFVVESNAATATYYISPAAAHNAIKISVKTITLEGTGQASLRIDYPSAERAPPMSQCMNASAERSVGRPPRDK